MLLSPFCCEQMFKLWALLFIVVAACHCFYQRYHVVAFI